MYCRMLRGIYIRANGEMACYCGAGEDVHLGQLPVEPKPFDFVDDFYHNPQHQLIRHCFLENRLPYPGVCLKCLYLQPNEPHHLNDNNNEKEIEWMHVEATSLCNLDCLFCIDMCQRNSFRTPPHYLPVSLYEKMIDDIARHKMTVKWGYFSGRGEPTLHKDIWKMVKMTKDKLDTNFLVNTNGNVTFTPEVVDCGLDKIKIAIDGTDQQMYETYRRKGSLARILDFTRSISEYREKKGLKHPFIIWQYVLFEHNDSLDALTRIQEMALEAGVDRILFKSTFTESYSPINMNHIPAIHPNQERFDMKRLVDIPSAEWTAKEQALNHAWENHRWEETIISGIDMAAAVFKKFMLGLERREMMNRYGTSDDFLLMILMAKDNHEWHKYMILLKDVFDKIAVSYDKTGNPEGAHYYRQTLQKINDTV